MSATTEGRTATGSHRAGRRAVWLVMLAAVVGLLAGFATKAPCIATYQTPEGFTALDWRDWRQYSTACYSDTIPLYGLERLDQGGFPYRTSWTDPGDGSVRYMEYPVVTGLLQWGAMVITKGVVALRGPAQPTDTPEVVVYFIVMSLVLAACWLAAVAATLPLARRPRDMLLVCLSPLVAVHLFTNFDALAVALAAGGMLAWARGRPGTAGVLLGLGAAAKLYPLLILGPLLVLCWRAGRLRPWAVSAGAAGAAWLVVNLPIALLYPPGWQEFFRLNSTRPADHDSVYNAISVLTGWGGFDQGLAPGAAPERLNLISLGLFALVCTGVALVGVTAPRRPRVASLAFLVVAGFLLTNKVWSPQYSLWLVPLAVLALPRVLPLLTWMTIDAALWYPRMGYFLGLADPSRGTSPETFATVVLVRDAAVLVLCALVLMTIYRPDTDPVRRAGVDPPGGGQPPGDAVRAAPDDPAGGPLDGAPDLRSLRRRPAAAQTRPTALASTASCTYCASPGAMSS